MSTSKTRVLLYHVARPVVGKAAGKLGGRRAGVMSNREEWLVVNGDLVEIGECLVGRLKGVAGKIPGMLVFLGYLRKATNTLSAVGLLCERGLFEQAAILVRSLFELRATFDCFLDMFRENPVSAVQRVVDAMMLEKIKQLESVGYHAGKPGEELIDREGWKRVKAEISERYSEAELRRMRRLGFTGLSVEERCKQVGHKEAYDIVYRNFSRNVHSSDYVEHIGEELLESRFVEEYLESRNCVMLYVAHTSAGWVMENVNSLLGGPMDGELQGVGRRQEALREWVHREEEQKGGGSGRRGA